jgi:hypothetical protein
MAAAKTKTRSKAAPKPPSRKVADKAQYERFVEAARQAEVDEDPEALDRAVDRIATSRPRPSD